MNDEIRYPVVEKFVSINGEGRRAGELAVFIRFRRCNLNCSYCDTRWANAESAAAEMMSAGEIAGYVRSSGVKNVTLTGGEPLLQQELYRLIVPLMESGCRVEIETNGSLPIDGLCNRKFRPSFTLDYKLPGSGMEQHMLTENYEYLTGNDTVKFVAGSRADLEKAAEIIMKYDLMEKCSVYLSPVFGSIDPAEIVDFMAENRLNDIRLQLQLHKFIWDPEKRGV